MKNTSARNQAGIESHNAKSSNFVLHAVTLTFLVTFLYLGKEYVSTRHQQEVAGQEEKKAQLLFDTPGALEKLIDELAAKAVKACGDSEVCFSKWKERDFPKYVDGRGLTENEKHNIAIAVYRRAGER